MIYLNQFLNFENNFGDVVILEGNAGFTVKYSFKKAPGWYRCRVNNTTDYDSALKYFNRYKGVLKRQESKCKK